MLIWVLTAKLHENAQPLSTVLSINKISGNTLCMCVTIIPQFLFCSTSSSCLLQVSCLHDLLLDLLCHHLLCCCSRKNKSPENITVQTKHHISILCTFSQILTNGELSYNHKFPSFLFTTVQIHIKNLVECSYPPWGHRLPSVWFPVVHLKKHLSHFHKTSCCTATTLISNYTALCITYVTTRIISPKFLLSSLVCFPVLN